MEQKKIIIPEGWEVDKVENGEIILKESKKELPKTWEECLKQLGKGEFISENSERMSMNHLSEIEISENDRNVVPVGLGKPMLALMQLLVCREIYRQGWNPEWVTGSTKWVILVDQNKIRKDMTFSKNHILSFQSEEVRDKFLENFKGLIEKAKMLL